jgi:hypothetical protein
MKEREKDERKVRENMRRSEMNVIIRVMRKF